MNAAEAGSGFVSDPLLAQCLPWGRGEIKLATQLVAALFAAGAAAERAARREVTTALLIYIIMVLRE